MNIITEVAIIVCCLIMVMSVRRKERRTVLEKTCDPVDSEGAGQTFKENENLSKREAKILYGGKCPDCSATRLLEGPSAGLSMNVYCGNDACGSRFNVMGPFGTQRITDASPKKYVTTERHTAYRN